MSHKNKRQFAVWMDSRHATVVGKEDFDNGEFMVIGHVNNSGADNNSNENASHNQEISLTRKYFKEIASHMPNADEMHITGTGQIQEQFLHFLAETPQYKHVVSSDSTSAKMSDSSLIGFVEKHFN